MTYNKDLREEEVKNKLRRDYFALYDATPILGNIDFAVAVPTDGSQLFETEYLLWAEAKKGDKADISESLVQLILTIGKARTFDHHLPPAFLGAFDAEKIAFLPYNAVIDIFYQNDFNWNVTPSNHDTREFHQVMETVSKTLQAETLLFHFATDDSELRRFIHQNFVVGKSKVSKVRINKNNFTAIYQKWRREVQPTIAVDWEKAKQNGIIDADFYLADILSEHNITLRQKLYVLLRQDFYELDRRIDSMGLFDSKRAQFSDDRHAHQQFWNCYDRPPRREYWDYIVARRDLLVPQDVRERKGSYFTPAQWVELSQQYLADELGENWQDEYYIWDCCAGTGNLLAGLTNKYRIWASTLDQSDVDVMHDRIANGANLLDAHVFRFDFLNDPFTPISQGGKLPDGLYDIINTPEKRRKLVIYINPPYAEAGNRKVIGGTAVSQKTGVAVQHLTYKKYLPLIGIAGRELFAQFIIRIYSEIPSSVLAQFSKLKIEQAPNFRDFREQFRAKLGRFFLVPADTFDNVKGKFPIGFFIWHLDVSQQFTIAVGDVYDKKGNLIGTKTLSAFDTEKSINDWIIETRNQVGEIKIGYMSCRSHDFSNVNYNFIMNSKSQMKSPRGTWVTTKNILETAIYLAVCHSIEATWLNDRDQFLYPNEGWKSDKEFQANCIAYTLFSNFNTIQSTHGTNNWIPYSEEEVGAKDCFESHFMYNYLHGKLAKEKPTGATEPEQLALFAADNLHRNTADSNWSPMEAMGSEAREAFAAGRELWRYYHSRPDANPNASLYDIRLYFQGFKTTKSGKLQMNTESADARYNEFIATLRHRVRLLTHCIEPKVYEYGFLKK